MTSAKLIDRAVVEVVGGNIRKIFQTSDPNFKSFGEAYISEIEPSFIKGWKMHSKMTCSLYVPLGHVKFVVCTSKDDCKTFELSANKNQILQIFPNSWFAFQGLGERNSMVLNIADIEHEPEESKNLPLDTIQYNWEIK